MKGTVDGKLYNIIYADPPWRLKAGAIPHMDGTKSAVEDHYPTMSTRDLMSLDIKSLAAPQCVLFMWATAPMLPECLQVMEAWGFRYKTVAFTWIKTIKDNYVLESGPGYYTRSGSEFVLLGTSEKGTTLPRKNKGVPQLVFAPRTRHSEKPAIVRQRIVDLYGDCNRIELFSRHVVQGWDRHGSDQGDIKEFAGLREILEVSFLCDDCGDQFDFYMHEGDDFECPGCGRWYHSDGNRVV